MSGFVSLIKGRGFDWFLVILALLSIALGSFGWWFQFDAANAAEAQPLTGTAELWWRISYVAGHVVRAFLFADVYASPFDHHLDVFINVSSWLATIVAGGALLKGIISVFLKPIARNAARGRKKHAVVIGARDIAARTCLSLRSGGWQVTYHGDLEETELPGVLIVPRPVDPEDKFFRQSVDGADRVVVAEVTDAETAEIAVKVATFAPYAKVFALFENPTLAAGLRQSNVAGLDDDGLEDHLIALSESRALARTTLIPAPPFLMADMAQHSRVHLLIYGFSPLALALIEETLYLNLVPGQKLPRFTILTPGAFAARQLFDARHPEFRAETARSDKGQVDIEFIECQGTAVTSDAIGELVSVSRNDPITAAYVTVEDDQEPVAAAIAMQTAARQYEFFDGPIFVQSRDGNGMSIAQLEDAKPLGLYTFGRWDDLIKALGLLDQEPDKLARLYHENYCKNVEQKFDADDEWEVLAESFRMANRNAILHLPAKLFAAGFDIRPYLTSDDALSPNTAPSVHPDAEIFLDAEMKRTLVELEHERWMIERRVGGHRYGVRDRQRLKHPDLKRFSELDDSTRQKDEILVEGIVSWIERDETLGLHRS